MEQLANNFAKKIAKELSYSDEQQQILSYGMIAILQTLVMTAIVFFIGALIGTFIESAILCFAVSFLRKYSGGTHAKSIESCTIVGVLFCTIFGLVSKAMSQHVNSFLTLILLSSIVFLYAFIIARWKAPVDSPNKPIRSVAKRKRMKFMTLITLSIYFVISMALVFFHNNSLVYVSSLICILFSIVWQISSLTAPGDFVLENIDRLIYRIITLKGGHTNEKI